MSEHKHENKSTEKKVPSLELPKNGPVPTPTSNGTQKLEAGAVPTPPSKEGEKKQKKEAKPKEPKVPRESNFKKIYPDNAVVHVLCQGNPKRPGTKAHETFSHYVHNGTVGEFIKKGGFYAALSWDVGHGFIKVTIPPQTMAQDTPKVGEKE